jgi:hypothetical protein
MIALPARRGPEVYGIAAEHMRCAAEELFQPSRVEAGFMQASSGRSGGAMSAIRTELRELVCMVERLSPGDRSVLRATLETPNSQIATVRDSPNDVLWSKLVELGFARDMTLEVDFPRALKDIQPKSFLLTEQGRVAVAQLLGSARPQ